jgi:hypothetical protein
MKLEKDPFPVNMNMVELDEKKILVQPSQAESRGYHRRRTATEDDQTKKFKGWPMVEEQAGQASTMPMPPSTSSWPSTRKAESASGGMKTRPSGIPSQIVPCQNSEDRDRRQQNYHLVPYFLIGPPMPELWGPLPCPPWAGWYGPWVPPPPMHFHSGWSGFVEGFGHGIYYAGDDRYGYVDHQHDSRTPSQENQMVRIPKSDGPASQKVAAAPGCRHRPEAPKDGSFAGQSGGSQEKTSPRSETSTYNETKPDVEKCPEEVATEQNRVSEAEAETKTEAGTSSRHPPNRTVQFPKSDHPVLAASG